MRTTYGLTVGEVTAYLHPLSQVLRFSVPTQPVSHLSRAKVLMSDSFFSWRALHWQRMSLSIEDPFIQRELWGCVSVQQQVEVLQGLSTPEGLHFVSVGWWNLQHQQ